VGAGIGGSLSFFVMELVGSKVFELSYWLASVLVKLGFPKSAFEWSNLYVFSGWVFIWVAAGAGIGWFLTRER